ncbi:MAG TPA: class I SAM-dependent methyltransferase [Candidatus Sulfotelmatobacter sp.]|nr:class I SAM-dependent methyltransferase [Candidatus Sulfotelmatobacter sp.]
MKPVAIQIGPRTNQCQKPSGWLGRLILWNMNSRHSKLTDWGLGHISVANNSTILDIGCGGGRTIGKLAAMDPLGKVYGIDHSEESVAASKRANARLVREGRVEVHHGSVSRLPFQESTFDLVTAVETHFWWPDPATDMCEVFRVLRLGGKLIVIAEIYKGANTAVAKMADKYPSSRWGMKLLDVDEHRKLFAQAGFKDIEVVTEPGRGWICGVGTKP